MFEEIKGQELAKEIITRRIQEKKAAGGYLFCGPQAVGKKMMAMALAKAIDCETRSLKACGVCPACLKIEKNEHPDVHFIDDSGTGSIKIEDIRKMQKDLSLKAYEAEGKIFIIDNAHNMTAEASNALLKTLEEPPKGSWIILISAKPNLLFKTIISRCFLVKFRALSRNDLEEILMRDFGLDKLLAHFLSFFCEGRLGEALKLKGTEIFRKKNAVIDEFCIGKSGTSLITSITDKENMRNLLNLLAVWLRDVYLCKSGMPESGLINIDRKEDVKNSSLKKSFLQLEDNFSLISESLLRLEQNINFRLIYANLKAALVN